MANTDNANITIIETRTQAAIASQLSKSRRMRRPMRQDIAGRRRASSSIGPLQTSVITRRIAPSVGSRSAGRAGTCDETARRPPQSPRRLRSEGKAGRQRRSSHTPLRWPTSRHATWVRTRNRWPRLAERRRRGGVEATARPARLSRCSRQCVLRLLVDRSSSASASAPRATPWLVCCGVWPAWTADGRAATAPAAPSRRAAATRPSRRGQALHRNPAAPGSAARREAPKVVCRCHLRRAWSRRQEVPAAQPPQEVVDRAPSRTGTIRVAIPTRRQSPAADSTAADRPLLLTASAHHLCPRSVLA